MSTPTYIWDPADLTAKGYRRVSRRFRTVARVDRPDWREELARGRPDGMKWVCALGDASAADHYRRTLSQDTLDLHHLEGSKAAMREFLKIPGSGWDSTGYIDGSGTPEPVLMYPEARELMVEYFQTMQSLLEKARVGVSGDHRDPQFVLRKIEEQLDLGEQHAQALLKFKGEET